MPVCNIFGLFCCTHTNFFIANIVVKMSNLKKTNIILERKTCEKQDSGVRTKLEPVDSFFSPSTIRVCILPLQQSLQFTGEYAEGKWLLIKPGLALILLPIQAPNTRKLENYFIFGGCLI